MPAELLHSIATVTSTTAASSNTSRSESCTFAPPIKPWPRPLDPKSLITLINSQQDVDLALRIFDYAGKNDPFFSHNYDTYNSIIQKLSRARAFSQIEILLSDLQKAEIKCSENLFITVIGNYGLSGESDLALKTFIRMKCFNVQQSVKSLNALLNAFVLNKRYKMALTMFENCRQLYGVVPDVSTCNILIEALCEKKDIEGALKVFDKMPSMRIIPNLVTYTIILGGYVACGDMAKAKKVIRDLLSRGWLPDARTYGVLMNGYCQQGRLDDAIKLMDEMEVEPNDVIYEMMIEAFCKEKKASEALNMFDIMLLKNYTPSCAICCKVIGVLCEGAKVKEACELWKRVFEKSRAPYNAVFSTLIHLLCKEGNIGEAKKLFVELEQSSTPSRITYNALLAGMCEKGELNEAMRLYDAMVEKDCKPNTCTYNMLIKGFSKLGYTEEGVEILKEMLGKECWPDKLTYSMLIEELFKMEMKEVNEIIFIAITNVGIDVDSWELFLNKAVTKPDKGTACLDRLLMENSFQL